MLRYFITKQYFNLLLFNFAKDWGPPRSSCPSSRLGAFWSDTVEGKFIIQLFVLSYAHPESRIAQNMRTAEN